MQGQRRDRTPPLAGSELGAVDAPGGQPVAGEERLAGQPRDGTDDGHVAHDAGHRVLVFDVRRPARRPPRRVFLLVLPELGRGLRREPGRHDERAGDAVLDDLVRNLQRREHEGAVRTGAPVPALEHDSEVINHVQFSFIRAGREYTHVVSNTSFWQTTGALEEDFFRRRGCGGRFPRRLPVLTGAARSDCGMLGAASP